MRYRPPSKLALLGTAAAALVVSLSFILSKPVEMRVDGQPLISDVPPVTSVRGAVFVPLRAIVDALGADTKYENKSGQITVTRGDEVLLLKIGSTRARLNGVTLTLGQAPFRVRGRVMVGLHALQRAFGVRVKFDHATARVDVETPGLSSTASRFQTQ